MDDDREDNARLEPAVRSAMKMRGSVGPRPGADFKQDSEQRPPVHDGKSFTLEQYTAGLNQEIEDSFLIRDWETDAIVKKLSEAYGTRYSSDDLIRAVALANELNYCAVFTQSSCGDGDQGIAELEKQVPGFSRGLYAELLGYMAYINR
jgi:hypothetical protein